MVVKLYIGNDDLDRFKDESIEINSSIANINDITKNTTDYSRSFTVPATNKNNRIFKHYYDANIDNSFDARVKQDGRIELDGIPFKYGKFRLDKVSVKQGRPYAYTLTFWGNLVSLKDTLKNDELSSLDFSEFQHTFNPANVKTGLTSSLFSGNLIYPLFVKKQLYYDSSQEGTNTDKLANISYLPLSANTGLTWNELRPALRVLNIIEAIETKYGVTFSRDFFGRTDFTELFIWLNNDSNLVNTQNNKVRMDFTNTGDIDGRGGVVDIVEDTFVAGGKRIYSLIDIVPALGYENVKYNIEHTIDGNLAGGFSQSTGTDVFYFDIERNTGQKHSWYISANQEFKFTSKLTIEFRYESYRMSATFPQQTITGQLQVINNLPKIKIIDFLNGLFKMFKLVVIADEYDNIYVDTLKSFYSKGSIWNISKYINDNSIDIERGSLLNEIKFKFQEPITILNKQFKVNTGLSYGDEETILTDDGTATGKPLDGESLSYELPFEQIVYERLIDLKDNINTNIMYGGIFDETITPVNPKVHLFYNVSTTVGTKTLGFINDIGGKELINGSVNIASHSIDFINPQYNLVFGIENNEWNGVASENTLYKNYHKDYVDSVFNIKRRNFKYKAILPLRILTQLKLNDVLQIKHDYYRIDNYNINLLSGEVSLNLINSFDNTINGFNADVNVLYADYRAQTQTVTITNLAGYSYIIESGTWLSLTSSGDNVYFAFEENNTGATRSTNVSITNTTTLQVIDIFCQQAPRIVTADNNIITADNNITTADNG